MKFSKISNTSCIDQSLYIPEDDKTQLSAELLSVIHNTYDNAELDFFINLERMKNRNTLDFDGSVDDSSEVTSTLDKSGDVPPDNRVIVPVHKDGRLEPDFQRYPFSDLPCSKESSTNKVLMEDAIVWEKLATERATEIKHLEYRIDIMQKVIRQHKRKCDRIKRMAEAATY